MAVQVGVLAGVLRSLRLERSLEVAGVRVGVGVETIVPVRTGVNVGGSGVSVGTRVSVGTGVIVGMGVTVGMGVSVGTGVTVARMTVGLGRGVDVAFFLRRTCGVDVGD